MQKKEEIPLERESMHNCYKCGIRLTELLSLDAANGKRRKTPKLLDAICKKCGYRLGGVKIPAQE